MTFEKPLNGKWTLNQDDTAVKNDNTDFRLVAIKLNEQWMKLGENIFADANQLKVAPNESKALPFDGQATKKVITEADGKGVYEKAFNVTYTLEMDEPEVTPAPGA